MKPKHSEPSDMAVALRATLEAHPFCKGMMPKVLDFLAENAMFAQFAKGEFIFREGDAANRFYLIRTGSVALESRQETGAVRVQTIGAGDVLGWSWLFPPHYWQFGARAVEDVDAVFIYGAQLRDLAEKDHDIGCELYKRTSRIVVQRLQATRQRLAEKGVS